ncbi:hypothetical protein OsI_34011 [Oryza sativa Indica Group]|uniref:Uncharacterized protein n=1 Tax=Oryza sativa subsp. indica TaxID=39946 RepID=B8BHF9_ORYSI|nr:hypothetical protein OsI_34011 [Oryza sativa Indica Group]
MDRKPRWPGKNKEADARVRLTAKTLRNRGQIDCTRGVSREQRAINRRKKLESSSGYVKSRKRLLKVYVEYQKRLKALDAFEKNQCAIEEERFGEGLCDREVSTIAFEEESFGHIVEPSQQTYRTSASDDLDLSDIVVSLALFDGDKMLFAFSGIPLPSRRSREELTSFVTSADLARAFNEHRNRDDNLTVAVRLPDNTTTDGFLGLYDHDIVIVTCLGLEEVSPIDFNGTPACPDGSPLLAAGRAFKSGNLMAMSGSVHSGNTWVPDSQDISKAVLGGPLLGKDNIFLGMNFSIYDDDDRTVKYAFLPMELLHERLKHFGILEERVWKHLRKEVVTDISRRVVSLASFNGLVRSFACTGLIINWHGSKALRPVILTSASLISHNEDKIDSNLKIEVFLPPNQRGSGILEFYSLNYNIAIVSLKRNFNTVRPENIFSGTVEMSSEKVVATGRDVTLGPLMATIGKVIQHGKNNCKLDCKDLKVSTCKITKAGIEGPLIKFDGSFVGMNFYDGSRVTPFLPKDKIVKVLSTVIDLPSESGHNHPMPIDVDDGTKKNGYSFILFVSSLPLVSGSLDYYIQQSTYMGNIILDGRWPVPEPYWYHGSLDVDMHYIPKLIGRVSLVDSC